MRPAAFCFWSVPLALGSGCGPDERPPRAGAAPPAQVEAGTDVTFQDAGCHAEPQLEQCVGDCGNLVLDLEQEPNNLYFIVDRSGSMAESLEGGTYSKYEHARIAMAEVLRLIGHRVRFGAAVFPGLANNDDCAPGGEIFRTRRGDYPECIPEDGEGPVLAELLTALAVVGTGAGTPTAATLERVTPVITQLEGTTSVILLTDGAPNCNPDASCTAADCTLTVDRVMLDDGRVCSETYNCCDPDNLPDGNLMCIDTEPTEAAVQNLADAGIRTYVVGMPGSEAYAAHLSRLAEVGGTARESNPRYYPVGNTAELTETLRGIVERVALSCDIPLVSPPPDPGQVNVCFDGFTLEFDAVDGWSWLDDNHTAIRINGAECEVLKSGSVQYVQVEYGCPTYVH
jgi:hypothetical protein